MAKNRASLKMPEEKKEKIIKLLQEGKMTKREIANKLKINSGYVYRLAAESNVGVAKAQAKKNMQQVQEQNQSTAEKIVESALELETTPVTKVKINMGKFTEEERVQIALECEAHELSYTDIAKKWGCAQSTISRIAKELGVPSPVKDVEQKEETKEEAVEVEEVKAEETKKVEPSNKITLLDEKDVEPIFKGSHVVCGLIAERHDMPCEEFIFEESLEPSMMHDYQYQYDICKSYIDRKISFSNDDVASADIICYMTGCQSVLGALVKSCFDSQVNLTLMHYDIDIKDYHPQVIFSHFKDENVVRKESYLTPFLEQYNNAFFYKCVENDIKNLKTFYIINKVNIGSHTTYDRYTKGAIQVAYICKCDGDAWQLYPKLAKEIMNEKNHNFCLYLMPVDQSDNQWSFGTSLAKSYNFKSEPRR